MGYSGHHGEEKAKIASRPVHHVRRAPRRLGLLVPAGLLAARGPRRARGRARLRRRWRSWIATASRGAPRFFKAARAAGIRPIVGAELSLDGRAAPCRSSSRASAGYRNLCRLITAHEGGRAEGRGRARPRALDGRTDGLVALAGRRDARRSARHRTGWPPILAGLRPRPASSSTCSATAGASRKRRTRRCSTWPTRSASRRWPPTACATRTSRGRAAPRRAHLHPREADARRPPAACWPRTPSGT